jgi:hemerythrin
MGVLFVWDESYLVGDGEIDGQHQYIFQLANSLTEDLDRKQIETAIVVLFKYVRQHFVLEEEMMKRMGYPKVREHIELHNDLIARLGEIALRPFSGGEEMFAFKKFMYDWIVDHISTRDKDYARFSQTLARLEV